VEAPWTKHGSTSINAGSDRLFIVLIRVSAQKDGRFINSVERNQCRWILRMSR
jgi:hypothetical protein